MPEDSDDKPLSDVKRAKHAADDKHHGSHGKTVRKLVSARVNRGGLDPRPTLTYASNGRHSYNSWGAPQPKKLLWTMLELEGRDASHSLDRDLAWQHVPNLLHTHAIQPPTIVKNSDGTIETTFQLEPLVEEIPDSSETDVKSGIARRSFPQQRTDGKLYQLKNSKRPTLFAVPPDDAPVEVRGKLLMPVRMGDGRNSRRFPLVRRSGGAVWDVTQHGGVEHAKLDIDLGADCLLSAVSTQGRQPPTRVYPYVRRERRRLRADLFGLRHELMAGLGRRAQRTVAAQRREETQHENEGLGDYYWVENRQWDLLKHGQYPGPFWDVLNLKGDEERCKRTGRVYAPSERWLQWVAKYEIRYRVDGGRSWMSLGVFKGNIDATSEVAHDLRGVRARYLRIVPLEAVGMGALRVGVYGMTAAAAAVEGGVAGEGGGEEAPEPISYTLRTCPEGVNQRFTHCEKYTYRGGHRWRDYEARRRDKTARLYRDAETRLHAWREHDEATDDELLEDENGVAVAAADGHVPKRLTVSAWVDDRLRAHAAAPRVAVRVASLDDACDDSAPSEDWSEGESELSEAWSLVDPD